MKKSIILSWILIIAGVVVLSIGGAMLGFNKDNFKETGSHKWYQAISYTDQQGWNIGINFGK